MYGEAAPFPLSVAPSSRNAAAASASATANIGQRRGPPDHFFRNVGPANDLANF